MSRSIPQRFTPQQRAFIQAVRETTRHLLLRAAPGSGKTTTVCEAAHHLDSRLRTGYFVYNKHNTADVKPRLPGHVWVQTAHAAGRWLLKRCFDDIQIDSGAGERLVERVFQRRGEAVSPFQVRVYARIWSVVRELLLVEAARTGQLDAQALQALLVQADVPLEWHTDNRMPELLQGLLADLCLESDRSFEARENPDFTDLLWWPYRHGLTLSTFDVILLDEAQDFTPLRQAFLLSLITDVTGELVGRFIAVGDPDQAIYRYSGATPELFMALSEMEGVDTYPLSFSFRCPTSHVRQARAVSQFIESPPGQALGTVEHIRAQDATFQRGDTVLCRKNAPLLALGLRLLRQNVSVDIRGLDIEKRLLEYGHFLARPFTVNTLPGRLESHWERVSGPLKLLKNEGDRAAAGRLDELRDLHACLSLLAEQALEGRTKASLATVRERLGALYQQGSDVLLSSVHKAKGLEWSRVTVLYPEMLPLPYGHEDEERCVALVALTRSTDVLRLAYGEASWESGWRWGHPRLGDESVKAAGAGWLLEELKGHEMKEAIEAVQVEVQDQQGVWPSVNHPRPSKNLVLEPPPDDTFLRSLFGDDVQVVTATGDLTVIPLYPEQVPDSLDLSGLDARQRLARRQRAILAAKTFHCPALAHLEAGDESVPNARLRRVLENLRYGFWLERARWANMVLREMSSLSQGVSVYLSAQVLTYLERCSEELLKLRHLAYAAQDDEPGTVRVARLSAAGLQWAVGQVVREDPYYLTVRLSAGAEAFGAVNGQLRFSAQTRECVSSREVFLITPPGADLERLPAQKSLIWPA